MAVDLTQLNIPNRGSSPTTAGAAGGASGRGIQGPRQWAEPKADQTGLSVDDVIDEFSTQLPQAGSIRSAEGIGLDQGSCQGRRLPRFPSRRNQG
jgi:hypothetical protein